MTRRLLGPLAVALLLLLCGCACEQTPEEQLREQESLRKRWLNDASMKVRRHACIDKVAEKCARGARIEWGPAVHELDICDFDCAHYNVMLPVGGPDASATDANPEKPEPAARAP